MKYQRLFKPFKIKKTVFRNRILSAPNLPRWFSAEGSPNEFEISYFEAKARGGAAQVTIGDSPVSPRYRAQPKETVVNMRELSCWAGVTELALSIRRYGAVASIELSHPGSAAIPAFGDGTPPVAPSTCTRLDGTQVLEMNEDMIEEAITAFADSAALAKQLGFDMCMVHSGHGWLLGQFLSPRTNRRTDRWGGCLENRARIVSEVLRRIRTRCGENFLIELRISADEFLESGITLEESIAFVKLIQDKIDLLHVSASNHNEPEVWEYGPTSHPLIPLGSNVRFAERFKKDPEIYVPIVAVCGILSPQQAEEILASGKADFVAMARALIADPELPNKARNGREQDIVPCIRCLNCLSRCEILRCSVAPATANSQRTVLQPLPSQSRRVAVIGGGPAGMQAAITAAERGHQVTLYEKENELGGMLRTLELEPMKKEVGIYKEYLIRKTQQLADVYLGIEVTAAFLLEQNYDYILAAIGANAVKPPIPGIDNSNVFSILDAYRKDIIMGDNLIVIGGGISGCEAALTYAQQGKHVTIIEAMDRLGMESDDINILYNLPLLIHLRRTDNITVLTGAKCTHIGPQSVYVTLQDGTIKELKADTVVYAVGMQPNYDAAVALADAAPNFEAIGDCVAAKKLVDATERAYFAALNIQ